MARQHLSDGVFKDHMQVTSEQKFLQPADGVENLGAAQPTDDADIPKLLHGAPARLWIYGSGLWAKADSSGKPHACQKRFVRAPTAF
jgi:hypothetical protein